MIRNYNGNVNRAVVRDLRKLCDVNAENKRDLFEAFHQNGEVSVYENLDPFTGCPDEMSNVVTMKSETEVKEYLKKDFIGRVERYLDHRKPAKDYLLCALIEFIKENGRFPEKDGMRQLEKNAEAKRIAELPSDTVTVPKEITEQDIAKEILELAEEIMESRRESNPDDIVWRDEPYPESLWIETDDFQGNILHVSWYGYKDFRDYSCAIKMRDYQRISINYCSDSTAYATAKNFLGEEVEISVTNYMITIHKGIVEMAKEAGIDFTSEIDYKKFQVA